MIFVADTADLVRGANIFMEQFSSTWNVLHALWRKIALQKKQFSPHDIFCLWCGAKLTHITSNFTQHCLYHHDLCCFGTKLVLSWFFCFVIKLILSQFIHFRVEQKTQKLQIYCQVGYCMRTDSSGYQTARFPFDTNCCLTLFVLANGSGAGRIQSEPKGVLGGVCCFPEPVQQVNIAGYLPVMQEISMILDSRIPRWNFDKADVLPFRSTTFSSVRKVPTNQGKWESTCRTIQKTNLSRVQNHTKEIFKSTAIWWSCLQRLMAEPWRPCLLISLQQEGQILIILNILCGHASFSDGSSMQCTRVSGCLSKVQRSFKNHQNLADGFVLSWPSVW